MCIVCTATNVDRLNIFRQTKGTNGSRKSRNQSFVRHQKFGNLTSYRKRKKFSFSISIYFHYFCHKQTQKNFRHWFSKSQQKKNFISLCRWQINFHQVAHKWHNRSFSCGGYCFTFQCLIYLKSTFCLFPKKNSQFSI